MMTVQTSEIRQCAYIWSSKSKPEIMNMHGNAQNIFCLSGLADAMRLILCYDLWDFDQFRFGGS
jgi:hypothetical protein